MKFIAILWLVFLLTVTNCFSQSIEILHAKKNEINTQIELYNKLLKEKQVNEKLTSSKLNLLESRIELTKNSLININAEIELINQSISNNEIINQILEDDLIQMKLDYANIIRFAQRNGNEYDALLFLISSETINQAYNRWLYIKQFSKHKNFQLNLISTVNNAISENIIQLNSKKAKQQNLINEKNREISQLAISEMEYDKQIKLLKLQQDHLIIEIRNQKKERESLDADIYNMLALEAKKESHATYESNHFDIITSEFEKLKGKLPWPVSKGLITSKFGTHKHPVMETLTIKNNGIDITTNTKEVAIAIFRGNVSKIFEITPGNKAVIIRHGNYLTVYSNLSDVFVKSGDNIISGSKIGVIDTKSNSTILKFQIWKENQKLNPELWIKNNNSN